MLSEPTWSIVICTRDRPEALVRTLDSVWPQRPLPAELILIDDGNLPDPVRDRIEADAARQRVSFRWARAERRGLTAARNQAARMGRGEILFYLDDDVTCAADCFRHVLHLFRDRRVAAVTATIEEPRFTSSASARLYQLGLRAAGWWRVGPRGRPAPPPPSVLARPHVATRARWLSGAAMAIRRAVVLDHPFDESLTEYALGEDREMGYRLMCDHWIVESKLARVVHRRDGAGRTEGRRMGFMTTRNYLYILRKTCRLGVGGCLLVVWNLLVLAAMHAAWLIGPGRRQHAASLLGMVEGLTGSLFTRTTARSEEPRPSGRRRRVAVETRATVFPPLGFASPTAPLPITRPRRHVLFVTNRLEAGGAELMLLTLVRRLPDQGIQPVIACLKDAGPLAEECRSLGIKVYGNLLHYKSDAAVISRLRRIFAEQRIDVAVVAHSGGDRMFWTTIAAALSGRPVVVWSHWFPLPGQRHFELLNRSLYRCVEVFVALGARQRRALAVREFVPAGRITVIPNAIELEPFLKTAVTRAEARRRMRLADDQFAVALIANLRREKRHDVFFRAARILSSNHPHMRFLVIGDGPDRDAVHAAAAASGLDHETLRLLGHRPDVADLLQGIDLSVLCSAQECFSVTMLEAAAAGVPFIGPDSGCMAEFLEHRVTGMLIKPADPASLADAMIEVASDAALRERITVAARRKVFASYNADLTVRSFADLFRSLPARAKERACPGRIEADRRNLSESAAFRMV